jgi:hypothetical protein
MKNEDNKGIHGGVFEQIEYTSIDEVLLKIKEKLLLHESTTPKNVHIIKAIIISPISWYVD